MKILLENLRGVFFLELHRTLSNVNIYKNIKHYIKVKGSQYSTTEHRVGELIPLFGSLPAGDVSHKPSGRLPLLSARPAVTFATLKRTATSFAAW